MPLRSFKIPRPTAKTEADTEPINSTLGTLYVSTCESKSQMILPHTSHKNKMRNKFNAFGRQLKTIYCLVYTCHPVTVQSIQMKLNCYLCSF